MGIYEDMNRIYGSSIFDSAVRRKNTFDVKPFDLKVPFRRFLITSILEYHFVGVRMEFFVLLPFKGLRNFLSFFH